MTNTTPKGGGPAGGPLVLLAPHTGRVGERREGEEVSPLLPNVADQGVLFGR